MRRLALVLAAWVVMAAAPVPETISLASDQWNGSPIQWSIRPDGSIVYTRDPRSSVIALPLHMVTRKSDAAPGRYRRIATLLAPARAAPQPAPPCRQFVTEGEQGIVRWGGSRSVRYNDGCLDPDAKPIERSIAAAQQQVAAWMKDAPITETHDVTTSAEVRRYDP